MIVYARATVIVRSCLVLGCKVFFVSHRVSSHRGVAWGVRILIKKQITESVCKP
jgi:hypothetical protein